MSETGCRVQTIMVTPTSKAIELTNCKDTARVLRELKLNWAMAESTSFLCVEMELCASEGMKPEERLALLEAFIKNRRSIAEHQQAMYSQPANK